MDEIGIERRLDDTQLLTELRRCIAEERGATARLLAHMSEVDARGLYRDEGFSSMFEYSVRSLHMSESEAGLRIRVARLGRQFPAALEMLARGELHMTALRLLAPVLRTENEHLLVDARFMSKEQVLALIAKHHPQPDVPSLIRRLPSRPVDVEPERAASPFSGASPVATSTGATTDAARSGGTLSEASGGRSTPPAAVAPQLSAAPVAAPAVALEVSATPVAAPAPIAPQPSATRAAVPLREGRFKVQFTASQQLRDKLELAEHLLRHQIPNGDIAAVIERALDLLIIERKKRMFAETRRPRASSTSAKSSARSRARKAAPAALITELREPGECQRALCGGEKDLSRAASAARRAPSESARGSKTGAKESSAAVMAETHAPSQSERAFRGDGKEPRQVVRDEAHARRERERTFSLGAAAPEAHSRYIPHGVRRAVIARDGMQCTFVGRDGQRCSTRGGLEFHHEHAYARGGTATVENIRMLCRAHNTLLAERDFGRALMVRHSTNAQVPERTPRPLESR